MKWLLTLILSFFVFCNQNTGDASSGQGGAFSCQAGDHDYDRDGIRDFSLECWTNGKRKKKTWYSRAGTVKSAEYTYYESNAYQKNTISYRSDGTTKYLETTYYESNEYKKWYTVYRGDGVTKYFETTYYESNENTKSNINYEADGVTFNTGYPKCYDTDGTTTETCSRDKHGIE